MNNQIKNYILPIIVFLGILVSVIFYIHPSLQGLNENINSIEAKETELASLTNAQEKLTSLEIQNDEIVAQLDEIKQMFILQDQPLDIIVSLEENANNNNLEQKISIGEESSLVKNAATDKGDDLYASESYLVASISLTGSYAGIQKYLLLLKKSALAYDVDSLNILSDSEGATTSATLIVKFFTLNPLEKTDG
ncbi:MAG: hypothetical protein ABIE68_00225 [bacterium]